MRFGLVGAVLLLFLFLLFAPPASAADPATLARFEKALEELRRSHYEYMGSGGGTFAERTRLHFGAYTTLAGYGIDDPTGHTRVLRQVDSKLWLHVRTEGHTFYGRARLRYQDYDTGDSPTGSGDGLADPVGDRYWYRFDWRLDRQAEEGVDPGYNWWVQAGRQYVDWVSGLVLSDTLYAARFGGECSHWRAEGMVGFTPSHSFVDFDASRPNFTSDTDRLFWAASLEYGGIPSHRPFAYVVGQVDNNDFMLPGGTRWGYDSTYASVGSAGQIVTSEFLYRAELIYEWGNSTSDILGAFPQTIDDISAFAGRFLLAYTPYALRESHGLTVEFELLIGSGDDDRSHSSQTAGGNLSGTTDESFNAFGYVNTGLALAPELANLVCVRLGASAIPLRGRAAWLDKLRVSADLFYYAKFDDNAPLSVSSTPGESYLGVGIDLTLIWQFTSDLALDLRYGIFVPGDAISGSERHFGYVGFSYGF